ncbi:NAD(P)-dependent oxidoreductase [Azospirillum sp. RWY-5-1]|uniref:NAD(P)-dependent oxidoreductase n=1 Tax=Azospirillum oleiclasticum TaxID=2735135 RepID=A0ABX2T309_9PROT|nr:NAD(P)-dependent oxidoreductase [Azospirillum oleiclasticum]NYZ11286.1 NAD(P)-dependent oxidoreductase [Azospirillum oleiclasticum]NYZ18447.1 NAD(P)-dependent oxidoreductase [Azospirillum oleiclasticum]
MTPTVLVSGAGGFVGREVLRRLTAQGVTATGLDLGDGPPGVPCRRGDATSFADVARAVRASGADTILALAALLPDATEGDPYRAATVNPAAAATAAEVARVLGLRRVVFASTIAVHGDQRGGEAVDEESPVRPNSLYGWSKAMAEAALARFREQGVDAVSLRLGFVFGPGRLRGVGAWADRFVADAVHSGRSHIPCRPEQEFLYSYVGWVADALAALALADRPEHAVYHSGGLTVTARDLAVALADAVPGTTTTFDADAAPLPFVTRADGSRLAALMGRSHPPLAACMTDHRDRVMVHIHDRSAVQGRTS